ncbi:hypothetical protein JMF89_17045 [Clostridiaceae bacterium UIB06]|nr:hypothetical protein [Clostridiaceae bacterium UIB06]
MPLRQFSRKERVNIIIDAKEGDELKTQIIVESFGWLKKSCYKDLIHKKDKILKEDYYQECDVKIIQCIRALNEINYGALSNLVEISIKHMTENFVRKNKRYNELNVVCSEEIDENKPDYRECIHNFDNQIVSDMMVYRIYEDIIKHQLSPKEKDIFFSHIKGESFENYAYKNAMKLESVKRMFRTAVSKIGNKDQIRKFHYIEVLALIVLKNMAVYMDLLSIKDLIVK